MAKACRIPLEGSVLHWQNLEKMEALTNNMGPSACDEASFWSLLISVTWLEKLEAWPLLPWWRHQIKRSCVHLLSRFPLLSDTLFFFILAGSGKDPEMSFNLDFQNDEQERFMTEYQFISFSWTQHTHGWVPLLHLLHEPIDTCAHGSLCNLCCCSEVVPRTRRATPSFDASLMMKHKDQNLWNVSHGKLSPHLPIILVTQMEVSVIFGPGNLYPQKLTRSTSYKCFRNETRLPCLPYLCS